MEYLPLLIMVAVLIFIVATVWLIAEHGLPYIESPEKQAGRRGEQFAYNIISEILWEDDILLNNVIVVADGKQAEFDNIIINSKGVFIIEVKNYSGEFFGDENDQEWIKSKMTPGGQFYQKIVRNPIGQVKRQIYVLSRYLKNHGINVWINGYVFFVQHNSPIESSYVLETQRDIDNAIHQDYGNNIDKGTIERIRNLF